MYYCGVERDCPRADGDGLAGDWAASNDSVHDVLVNKKFNATLVFILFCTEEDHVFYCFAKVLPPHFTEPKDVPSVPVQFTGAGEKGKVMRVILKTQTHFNTRIITLLL